MCSLERKKCNFEGQETPNSLYFSLLAGNLGGERLAPDCALRRPFIFCYLQYVTTTDYQIPIILLPARYYLPEAHGSRQVGKGKSRRYGGGKRRQNKTLVQRGMLSGTRRYFLFGIRASSHPIM